MWFAWFPWTWRHGPPRIEVKLPDVPAAIPRGGQISVRLTASEASCAS